MPEPKELAFNCAKIILEGYERYNQSFKKNTRRSKSRFERCDWQGRRADVNERLDLHEQAVNEVVDALYANLMDLREKEKFWRKVKGCYLKLIQKRIDLELAETFYISVTRRLFKLIGANPDSEYLYSDLKNQSPQPAEPIYRTHYLAEASTAQTVGKILEDCQFQVSFEDMSTDVKTVTERIEARLWREWHRPTWNRIEILKAVFYRNKGAYIVGRIWKHGQIVPLLLVLLNTEKGIYVDAVLMNTNEISIVFSFARSYFFVDEEWAQGLIQFLKTIIPLKRVSELYSSIGHNKHGKRELFLDLFFHLRNHDDRFIFAPGIRGMVMVVFTLASFPVVFKVIRDRFDYPKSTTREKVMEKYHLVFKHDRVGRLVDAQEFKYLKFERKHFSEEVLDELLRAASRNVMIDGDYVIVKHLYTERRITPLDIYIREAPPEIALEAISDYGKAIKELAAANIFPGDIFLKNFGVTRNGRVVFYDYDELMLLTDCRFRKMPQARTYEDELSAEPWFHVSERDVFPEEFAHFLGLNGSMREAFFTRHGELCDVAFWRQIQERQKAGEIIDVFPYRQRIRLRRDSAQ
jgi:isocitrate dehydrogenase kinase/phosphatase